MGSIIPSWTDDTTVIAAIILDALEAPMAINANGTLNLIAKRGAWLYAQAGRVDDTAITGEPVLFYARRFANGQHPPLGPFERVGGSTTAADTTVDADSASSQHILNVTNTTGFAGGDLICIMDPTPAVTRLEFQRVSHVTNPGAGGELVLDNLLENTHTAAQADIVVNQADLFQMWLPGGSNYDMGFDYGLCTAGPSLAVRAFVQEYDQETTA